MNNMKSKENQKNADVELQKLSLSIGDFIRYWGFRRIHGAIWTQLYLSKTALSCTDLTLKLNLSKALISPALDELCQYRLIEEVASVNEKTKLYQAVDNINQVIQHVLKTREKKMLKQIRDHFSQFKKANLKNEDLNESRVQSLEDMILSAHLMLEVMLAQNDLMKLPEELEK